MSGYMEVMWESYKTVYDKNVAWLELYRGADLRMQLVALGAMGDWA